MSRILETVLSWFLDAATFFDNIKARRSDDEVTARCKQLQRPRVCATALPFVVLVLGFLAGSLLEALDAVFQHAKGLDDLRSTALAVGMMAFAVAIAYAAFCYWRLWHFYRDEWDAA